MLAKSRKWARFANTERCGEQICSVWTCVEQFRQMFTEVGQRLADAGKHHLGQTAPKSAKTGPTSARWGRISAKVGSHNDFGALFGRLQRSPGSPGGWPPGRKASNCSEICNGRSATIGLSKATGTTRVTLALAPKRPDLLRRQEAGNRLGNISAQTALTSAKSWSKTGEGPAKQCGLNQKPNSTAIAQSFPKSGQVWPNAEHVRSVSPKCGRIQPESRRNQAKVDNNIAPSRSKSGEIWLKPTKCKTSPRHVNGATSSLADKVAANQDCGRLGVALASNLGPTGARLGPIRGRRRLLAAQC